MRGAVLKRQLVETPAVFTSDVLNYFVMSRMNHFPISRLYIIGMPIKGVSATGKEDEKWRKRQQSWSGV